MVAEYILPPDTGSNILATNVSTNCRVLLKCQLHSNLLLYLQETTYNIEIKLNGFKFNMLANNMVCIVDHRSR